MTEESPNPLPRENPDLIGQEAAGNGFLPTPWMSGRLPHAWLITGPAWHRQSDARISVLLASCWLEAGRGHFRWAISPRAWRSIRRTRCSGARRPVAIQIY